MATGTAAAVGDSNTQQQPDESGKAGGDGYELVKALNLNSDDELDLDASSSSSEDEYSDEESDHEPAEAPREGAVPGVRGKKTTEEEEEKPEENTPEANVRRFAEVIESRRVKKREEEEDREYEFYEDLFDFPKDPERWTEEDLQEYWADAPLDMTKPGWDPVWADEDDWEVVRDEIKAGRDPPIAPFYVPYRKFYPAIPDNHYDISNPKAVIEELDRIEEFLKWVSYIFPDGSSYEGTVWDDLAHGKGVYVADQGLVRYEGEWLQNMMDGHGVVEVDIPDIQPIPGSKLEAKMRAEGKIITRDFMSPEDRKWLEMDIEDTVQLVNGHSEIPFYERDEWVNFFGEKPEKGRYKYAGQWKHGRMHGCGVYEVNERIIYGRFYFGEHLDDSTGCDEDVSALHAGIAEVAAAKARMFINKPDGMVREERGPYGDPQHPYFYEDEDVWMAPGFINQFYEVPDYWKTYIQEVDQEREMWLNSFYKSPLRLPMPAELEYWWEHDDSPEFVLINKEPEPDPQDPSKLIYTEDPLILHTRTGRIINYVEDEKHGVRLFWQPPLKEGEDVDPDKVEFLPLGFDEFYGRAKPPPQKESWVARLFTSIEDKIKPVLDRLEKWSDEKKKTSEMKVKLMESELELVEAELSLEEELEDFEWELKRKEKEEEKAAEQQKADENQLGIDEEDGAASEEEEPSSFGTTYGEEADQSDSEDDDEGGQQNQSPFSSLSLSFSSRAMTSVVPLNIMEAFVPRKKVHEYPAKKIGSVSFHRMFGRHARLRAMQQARLKHRKQDSSYSRLNGLAQILSSRQVTGKPSKKIADEALEGATMDHRSYLLSMMALGAAVMD